jgi:hypothetical protein
VAANGARRCASRCRAVRFFDIAIPFDVNMAATTGASVDRWQRVV